MARVDHLPEGAREVLRTGSVIEREFSHELIRKVTGLPEQELLSHLSTLRDSELLYERGIYPNSTYIFKHALTREVVYDSILTKKRKQIHAKIARTIEEIFGNNICDCYGVLANHCMACEDYERGAEYARLEAKRLQKAGSFRDAIEYAKTNITCLERLPRTDANQKRVIDARTMLANYYLSLNLHYLAREAVEPILDLALALNYRKRLPAIYTAMGTGYLLVEEDSHKGFALIDQGMKMAEEVADYLTLWIALHQSGCALANNSEFAEAHKRLQQCLDFSLLGKNPIAIAYSKGAMSCCYQIEGKVNPAHEFAQETLTLAKETGDVFIKGMAYPIYGASCYHKGLFDEAKTHLVEWVSCYEKPTPVGWAGWGYLYLGCIYIDFIEYDNAVDCYKKIIQILEKGSLTPSVIKYFQSCLMRAKVLKHDRDIDLGKLFACYQNLKLTWCEGRTAGNIGDVLLHVDNDHLSDAEAWFQKAIDADTRNGFRWQLATDHALYANWFKKKGDIQGAKEQLTKAIDLFRECGADGWVTRTERELANLG